MRTPADALADVLRLFDGGHITRTEAFWLLVGWAGGDGVGDDDIRSLPAYWRREFAEELSARPSTRYAHPVLLRHAFPGPWDGTREADARALRDRAFDRLSRILLAEGG